MLAASCVSLQDCMLHKNNVAAPVDQTSQQEASCDKHNQRLPPLQCLAVPGVCTCTSSLLGCTLCVAPTQLHVLSWSLLGAGALPQGQGQALTRC